MLINHGIKGRIYPTEKQKVQIAQNCGSSRFVWNQLLGVCYNIITRLKQIKKQHNRRNLYVK